MDKQGDNKYNGSEEQMQKFSTLMQAYGVGSGINFKFTGTVASTLNAHRVIQHFQEEKGLETADELVNCEFCQTSSLAAGSHFTYSAVHSIL